MERITNENLEKEIKNEMLKYFHIANQEKVKGNREMARKKMAVAWGFARYIEDLQNMERIVRSLKKFGLTDEGLRVYQNCGYEEAVKIVKRKDKKRL